MDVAPGAPLLWAIREQVGSPAPSAVVVWPKVARVWCTSPEIAGALVCDVPASARRGEIIEIKTLVAHVMEPGFRRSHVGVPFTTVATESGALEFTRRDDNAFTATDSACIIVS